MKPHHRYLVPCKTCTGTTNRAYAKKHDGHCKRCVDGASPNQNEREARILDHGYQAYAIEEGHYDDGNDR